MSERFLLGLLLLRVVVASVCSASYSGKRVRCHARPMFITVLSAARIIPLVRLNWAPLSGGRIAQRFDPINQFVVFENVNESRDISRATRKVSNESTRQKHERTGVSSPNHRQSVIHARRLKDRSSVARQERASERDDKKSIAHSGLSEWVYVDAGICIDFGAAAACGSRSLTKINREPAERAFDWPLRIAQPPC